MCDECGTDSCSCHPTRSLTPMNRRDVGGQYTVTEAGHVLLTNEAWREIRASLPPDIHGTGDQQAFNQLARVSANIIAGIGSESLPPERVEQALLRGTIAAYNAKTAGQSRDEQVQAAADAISAVESEHRPEYPRLPELETRQPGAAGVAPVAASQGVASFSRIVECDDR
jgi:hypothetical protein